MRKSPVSPFARLSPLPSPTGRARHRDVDRRQPARARPRRLVVMPAMLAMVALAALHAGFGGPGSGVGQARAAVPNLADQPLNPSLSLPANVLLALSVEFPTGNVQAHNDERSGTGCPGAVTNVSPVLSVCYFEPAVRAARANAANASNSLYVPRTSMPYIGYFDPFKCYLYDSTNQYFYPVGHTSGYSAAHHYSTQPATSTAACNLQWSGNFLNWATMQTIDLFRWAMTGGDRQIDTATLTVLQKGRQDGQGGASNAHLLFPVKAVGETHGDIPPIAPSTVSPYSTPSLYLRVRAQDTNVQISTTRDFASFTTLNVGVRVCDPALPESATTCTAYGSSLKPTGLVQEHADTVRFAVFAYLLDPSVPSALPSAPVAPRPTTRPNGGPPMAPS